MGRGKRRWWIGRGGRGGGGRSRWMGRRRRWMERRGGGGWMGRRREEVKWEGGKVVHKVKGSCETQYDQGPTVLLHSQP